MNWLIGFILGAKYGRRFGWVLVILGLLVFWFMHSQVNAQELESMSKEQIEQRIKELESRNAELKKQELESLSKEEIEARIKELESQNLALKAKSAELNKEMKKGFLGFCRGKYVGTGCFIGLEAGYAIAQTALKIHNPNETTNTLDVVFNEAKSANAPMFNAIFGYQWYFKEKHAFRFIGNVGYAYYNANFTMPSPSGTSDSGKITSHALQYGIEAKYMYDFLLRQQYRLGLNVGIGFEGSYFINRIIGGGQTMKAESYSKFASNQTIGLHYVLRDKHQIFLTYSWRTYYNDLEPVFESSGGTKAELATYSNQAIKLAYSYKF